jgi:hypothetical protein
VTAASVGRLPLEELKVVLPPMIYFFCVFNLIVFTTNLMVHHYWFAVSNFLVATMLALIVGKVFLVSDKFHFIDRYRGPPPLIRAITFKTLFYSVIVMLVRVIEVFVHIARDDRGWPVAFNEAVDNFTWYRFAAIQVWLLACFLIYVTVVELNAALGKGRLADLLFRWPAD